MTALFAFLVLDIALLAAAGVLLVVVIVRGRSMQYLALAALLIVLAIGVWYEAIRQPIVLP
ncbi:MAG TPA: hypothetical protein VI814_12070 [Candidatus Limnocylindria bacterium]